MEESGWQLSSTGRSACAPNYTVLLPLSWETHQGAASPNPAIAALLKTASTPDCLVIASCHLAVLFFDDNLLITDVAS